MSQPPEQTPWTEAIAAFEDDLTRRAVAEKTHLAYLGDTRDFARWAQETDAGNPAKVDLRTLRRYAAGLAERGIAPATIARRLAALRGLFRVQMELGTREDNPAELLSSPKRPQLLRDVLNATDLCALLATLHP